MKQDWKSQINEQLCRMAGGIQIYSSSCLCWGEAELPDCLREELEETNHDER